MADIHVEDFYKDVAVALVQLYSVFPRRTNLFVEDIAGPDEPDEFGLHSPRHMACFGALLWLEEEGLLRYVDTIRQEALDQAVLTQQAFVRLSTPAPAAIVERISPPPGDESLPSSIRRDLSSYAHLLKNAIKSGNSDRISLTVQSAFFAETLAGHFH
ncbi:hypothetical protein SAMN05216429_10559 [Marinobacter persicus]|uniref:Uncharacterized protein n=1 Tax=Marinobacter persicus TaxID=930118 RepID=A0A1I3TLY7_9GAMM|nr:hypothetical protein [Marinobacter persicus]GHD46261.1 hypothetical protein GCM10008110_13010 [Marinobacter persicus]SFJ71543.1 hypothetical protein SAMN05216429_10559 [Marinobacter persicus]